VTIGLSTYLILYSHPLYDRIAPWLGPFERRLTFREQQLEDGAVPTAPEVILFGLGRYGDNMARGLQDRGVRVLGVDFDPQAIGTWHRHGRGAQYGDAEDPEIPATLPLGQAIWVVSAIPIRAVNLALLHALRTHGFRGKVALTAHGEADVATYQKHGADLVLRPFVAAAEQAAGVLSAALRSSVGSK